MNINTRVDNLEALVKSLIEMMNNNKFYTDADIIGVRKNITEITPYTETRTAYYDEREKTFYNVPDGNVAVFFDNYSGNYSVKRIRDRVYVSFEKMKQQSNITISVK